VTTVGELPTAAWKEGRALDQHRAGTCIKHVHLKL
jgi:hypothetical protein